MAIVMLATGCNAQPPSIAGLSAGGSPTTGTGSDSSEGPSAPATADDDSTDDGFHYDVATAIDLGSGPTCWCSNDLKTVICNGVATETCEGDTACANAECIDDPCLAAEINRTSVGCEFYAAKTAIIPQGNGACFTAFIANTWNTPVKLTAEYAGMELPIADLAKLPVGQGPTLGYQDYDPTVGLAPGEVAILFLSREPQLGDDEPPDCPVPAGIEIDAGVTGTGRGHAFRLTADRPVVAYQLMPFGGGSAAITSASLLLPTSAWGTNHVAINAYRKSIEVPEAQPSMTIVARDNGTELKIQPAASIVGSGEVQSAPAGGTVTYALDAGETLQITQDEELTGSPMESNKPIGVFGAASCLSVLPTTYACDSAHQQIPPVRALGSEYAAVRYRGRNGIDEAPPWRLVGIVDDTQLSWTPEQPIGAPLTIDAGEIVEFASTGPWVVASQDQDHPFYVAAYMTGGQGFGGEGDAEWVNVVPTDQYLDSYVFFTDPTYSETSLTVVRRRGTDGDFAPVELECRGELSGWLPLGDYEYTRVDLVTGDFQPVDGCENGRHELHSTAAFGATVWGWGSNEASIYTRYVSYAYPVGASLVEINDVLVPAG